MLKITLKKGLIGKPANQRSIVAALGLHKYGSSVEHHPSPTINGMVKKISHLITVEECKTHDAKKVHSDNNAEVKKPKPKQVEVK